MSNTIPTLGPLTNSPSPTPVNPRAPRTDESNALNGVGKSDFLKLLVAQLRNQDPLKPLEDKEFIAQMAQLNTVEQVAALNQKMGQLLSYQLMGQASALIGKNVEAKLAGQNDTIRGLVQEVRIEDGSLVLLVGGQRIGLTDITRISPPS